MGRDRDRKNIFEIYTRNTKTLFLRFTDRQGNPIDLTNCTEISVALPNADGSFTTLTLTGTQVTIPAPAILGNANARITSQISALLNIGEYQDFTATLTIGADTVTVDFKEALSVFEL